MARGSLEIVQILCYFEDVFEQNLINSASPTQILRRGHEYGVHHFLMPSDGLLQESIAQILSLTSERVEELLRLGSIYVNHRRLSWPLEKEALLKNDYVRVHTTPRRYPASELQSAQLIVADEEDFLVINKPSGIPVHPTVDNLQENLTAELSRQLGFSLYVTHRLDVVTEGLIVFAKTKSFQTEFNRLLAESAVRKVYRCLVQTDLVPAHFSSPLSLVHYMEPSPRAPKKLSSSFQEGWAMCSLQIIEQRLFTPDLTELKIRLETGRTHQIRSQLAVEGCPIVGDRMYGSQRKMNHEQIALQSCELSFLDRYQYQLLSPWSEELVHHL